MLRVKQLGFCDEQIARAIERQVFVKFDMVELFPFTVMRYALYVFF